jgi:hypothetical protein
MEATGGGSNQDKDLLNINEGGFDPELEELLERGKTTRVQILEGTESADPARGGPFARTNVRITFEDEDNLRECVRLLRWSDERLRARPEQLLLWDWQNTFREGMTISFGVNWYRQEFFEARKEAFREPGHAAYYARFGAAPDDFTMDHEILG